MAGLVPSRLANAGESRRGSHGLQAQWAISFEQPLEGARDGNLRCVNAGRARLADDTHQPDHESCFPDFDQRGFPPQGVAIIA